MDYIEHWVKAENKNYPQFSDHYFTGEYPVKPIDELGK